MVIDDSRGRETSWNLVKACQRDPIVSSVIGGTENQDGDRQTKWRLIMNRLATALTIRDKLSKNPIGSDKRTICLYYYVASPIRHLYLSVFKVQMTLFSSLLSTSFLSPTYFYNYYYKPMYKARPAALSLRDRHATLTPFVAFSRFHSAKII